MTTNRTIILLLAISAVVTAGNLPCWAEQKDEESIWTEEEPRGPRRGFGPRRGPAGFELTNEEIDCIINSLRQSDPEKAKELTKLRKEDPEKFQAELRKHGREEFGKIMRERIETWRRKRQADFLEWFGKNYPRKAEELAKLKETKPDVYWKKFDRVREKYWRIFEEKRRNPELAEVLKEDLELKEKREELRSRIKAAKSEKEKKKLVSELEEVVSRRFDLIIRRKQIEYEWLLKRIEELQKQLKESKAEIAEWRDEKFKNENVKVRLEELISQGGKFKWD